MSRLDFRSMGIISGDQKRALECFVDCRAFKQRKNFDEFTFTSEEWDVSVSVKDLMILAEVFVVAVTEDSIVLSDR